MWLCYEPEGSQASGGNPVACGDHLLTHRVAEVGRVGCLPLDSVASLLGPVLLLSLQGVPTHSEVVFMRVSENGCEADVGRFILVKTSETRGWVVTLSYFATPLSCCGAGCPSNCHLESQMT